MTNPLIVVDLFAGTGGFSVGFHREGFKCFGVDRIDVGYPYELIIKDVRDFHPSDGWIYKDGSGVIDVIVASPPCTEYSHLTLLSYRKGERGPPEPYGPDGLPLLEETLRIIEEAKPKIWILENVQGALPFFEPHVGRPRINARPWYLWGNFPIPDELRPQHEILRRRPRKLKGVHRETKRGNALGLPEDFPFDPLRSWRRARLPVFLAQALARACKENLSIYPQRPRSAAATP